MVKKRIPPKNNFIEDKIKEFAQGADNPDLEPQKDVLDVNAIRDYKAIRVPFNEYEYKALAAVAEKTGRAKLNVLRWAILKLAEEEGIDLLDL